MSTAATAPYDINAAFEPRMKGPLISSAALHMIIVVIAIVGLPYITPELPDISDPITVELVDIDEITATNKPKPVPNSSKKQPEQTQDEPPKPVQPQMTAKTPPKPVAPKPPEPKAADTTPPEPDDIAPPKKMETVKPPPPKPVQRPTKPEPEPKQDVQQETQQEEFKSLLRNLMPTEEEASQTKNPGEAEPSSMLTRFSERITMSEMDALKRQLNQCWSVMAGARYAEDLIVDLKLFMNPDRSVRDIHIVNQMRYNSDTFFRAAADAARRAVFRCSPLDVPPAKYELWSEIEVRFDPRKML
ncbi:MAG: energy transducer TonB [Rhodospirillales bacterium]|nr:energy transducer TonB [Rhodospirillales bacterium]MCB9995721.1 energy transducer TonB [Rhodospirillales bacterium]